jgi:hypothetical protein
MGLKCDFCHQEAKEQDMIIEGMAYHACRDCQNRVFKLIRSMIREYVAAGEPK